MAKLTLTDITAGYGTSTIDAANNALIEAAVENTLSRDGTSPNTMSANLDLNSNKIVNLTDGTNNQDAVSVSQLNAAALGTVVLTAGTFDAGASTDGQVLTSDGAGTAAWETAAGVSVVAGDVDAEASTDGYVLTSDGAGNAAWEAGGAGDVIKVGTPANNEMAVWTGDGTLEGDSTITTSGGTISAVGFSVNDGQYFTLGNGNDGQISYVNGTDQVLFNCDNATDLQFTMGTGYITLDTAFKSQSIYLGEQAAAKADITDFGQVWVKSGAPNTLWFTDDAGTDVQLNSGSGNVSNTGTPVNDQIAVWTDATTVEGSSSLSYTSSQLTAGNYVFNTNQTVGAGQDNYILTYDDASGEIGLEAAAAASGDVTKVGTPVDNQVGVWTGDGTLEGATSLTYASSLLQVSGAIKATEMFQFRNVITSELADIADAINTTAAKVSGSAVWNATTNKLMIAVGGADGDVWKSADGGTTITPS